MPDGPGGPISGPGPDDDAGDRPDGTAVWPNQGPTTGGTWVTVQGTFDPGTAYYVHLGGAVHQPVVVTPWALGFRTEASAPGLVDAVVHSGRGDAPVVHQAAFTYVAPDGNGRGGTPIVDVPDAPDVPETPGDGPTPVTPELPGAPGIELPDVPDVEVPDAPEVPDVPGAPDVPDAPDAPGTPDVEVPDGPDVHVPELPGQLRLVRITTGPLSGLRQQMWNQRNCHQGTCEAVSIEL